VSPIASGLIGDWVAAVKPGSTDTTLMRFAGDGTVEQVRIEPSQGLREVPWGPFRVYGDTGRTQLLCFSFRRGRALPACRYFQVDTLTDASGRIRRELQLLNWVEEKRRAPEIWTERAP
jgi:hypothetical protein